MNQPVEQCFEKLERRQADTERTLDLHTEMLREHSKKLDMHTQAFQKIVEMLNIQQETISTLHADVISVKATQSDHGELLKQILAKLP
jgi:septal ring factor EnvC (AmiA/AmiB activator)